MNPNATYDDPTKDVQIYELDERERRIFEAGFLYGYAEAAATRQAEIDALNHEADRYYAQMCRRPAPAQREHVSYAELCRRRGEYAGRAGRSASTRMFPGMGTDHPLTRLPGTVKWVAVLRRCGGGRVRGHALRSAAEGSTHR